MSRGKWVRSPDDQRQSSPTEPGYCAGKPFQLRQGEGIIAEFWNKAAAKIRMQELGGGSYVFSKIENCIIFSPLDE